jgi:anti-sigma regulatory factor (Ser/Thr protein kinase)
MKQITVEAKVDNLNKVQEFIDAELEAAGCGFKEQMQIDIAVEEVFVNIASYAYPGTVGDAHVSIAVSGEPPVCRITFADSGLFYDPLAKPDPDISLTAEDRPIGGLGIYMTKKSMDDLEYEYTDGQNRFTLIKKI